MISLYLLVEMETKFYTIAIIANGRDLTMSTTEQRVIRFMAERGISEQTLLQAGCEPLKEAFSGEDVDCIKFPYMKEGKEVNYKIRTIDTKEFRAKKDAELTWYNLDNVLEGLEKETFRDVYVVEGEIDCLSLIEAGIPNVLSVPSGAPTTANEDAKSAKKYEFVHKGMEFGLDKVRKWILATDSDDPGLHLRSDLSAVIGKARCYFIEWPEGIKDANDALLSWGGPDLAFFLREDEKEYPLDGLYLLSDIPEPPSLVLWESGFPELEGKFNTAPTCVSVCSGYPGHGKSDLTQQMWCQIAMKYNINVLLMSMETRIRPFVVRKLRSTYHNMKDIDLSDIQKREADDFVQEHFIFMQHENNEPSFMWVVDRIIDAHIKYGIQAVSIDPFNMLKPEYGKDLSETRWIGQCLDRLTALAKTLSIHIQVLTHPSKPGQGDSSHNVMTYDRISGSQHWANKPDQVWTIHRDNEKGSFTDSDGLKITTAKLKILKSRYRDLGWCDTFPMKMNMNTFCYECSEFDKSYKA